MIQKSIINLQHYDAVLTVCGAGENLRNAECYKGFITFKANLLVLNTLILLRRQAVIFVSQSPSAELV